MDTVAIASQAEPGRVPPREVLRARIVDLAAEGRILPGALTSENEIAEMLGEGRTPVREAVALLAGEGLFDQVPQKGIRLRPISREDSEAILALRTRIETLVVETLAGLEDRHERLARPMEALNALTVAALKDVSGCAAIYAALHVSLALAAGYRTGAFSLRSSLDVLRLFRAAQDRERMFGEPIAIKTPSRSKRGVAPLFATAVTLDPREIEWLQILIEEHATLDAVRLGKPDLAGKVMARHLRESTRRLVPARRFAPALRTEKMLLSTAGYFERSRQHDAASLAVTRLADVCVHRGQFARAAKIFGSRYVGVDLDQGTHSGTVRIVKDVLGARFDRTVAQGRNVRTVDDLQALLAEDISAGGSSR